MTPAMRKTLKAIFLIAITMGVAIAVSTISYQKHDEQQVKVIPNENIEDVNVPNVLPSKKISRFLADKPGNPFGRNPRAADHCNKDYQVCAVELGGSANATCCGNKCFDLAIAKHHCGACHKKCKYTYNCCNGQCVDIAFDKRHCGRCNQKCLTGQYCIYGMCDYA